jgi:RES domain-containing protein
MMEFKYLVLDVPDDLIETLPPSSLPPDWKDNPAPPSTKLIGDQWYDADKTPVLKVHSTVIDVQFNFLVKPVHSEYSKITVTPISDFAFDPRLAEYP